MKTQKVKAEHPVKQDPKAEKEPSKVNKGTKFQIIGFRAISTPYVRR